MKKVFSTLLAAGFIALVACGPSAEETKQAEQAAADSAAQAAAADSAAQAAAAAAAMPADTAMATDTAAAAH